MGPVLQLESVSKSFHRKSFGKRTSIHAVRDVNLSLGRGEVLAIVGESGSGKSTLARLITHLESPTVGRILVDGLDAARLRRLSEKIQMVFQDPFGSLNPSHSVGYAISRPMLAHGKAVGKGKERVLALLETVGLTPAVEFYQKMPHELSGGQRQRVVIARVLGLNPQLLVLDEPTSMLDVSIGIDIMNLLLDIRQNEGLSMIFITHNLSSAWYMADNIAVMLGGQVVETGAASRIVHNPLHPYTRLLLSSSPDPRRVHAADAISPITNEDVVPHTSSGCPFQQRCPLVTNACKEGSIGRASW